MKLIVVIFLLVTMQCSATSSVCRNDGGTRTTKPLFLLTLAPFPNPTDGTRWDEGLATVSGARVARDEINDRADLLPGYHIELIVDDVESCSHTRADTGLTNLVRYTANPEPECQPVVAVNGLVCSSHTSILSPVAGHEGYDLIQLAAGNSPIFQTENDRFPHLWRFLGSATVYSDTIIAIMNQFDWNRVGLVFDSGNVFYSENAKYLLQQLKEQNKTVVLNSEIRGSIDVYFDSVISGIKSSGVTVLVVMLNEEQSSILLKRVLDEQMIYPQYTWIHVETILNYLLDENLINHNDLYNATRGHILLHTLTRLESNSLKLVSGGTYGELETKYLADLANLREIYMYNASDLTSNFIFGSYFYDEVWAFALAVNSSLPILASRNLSIDDYGFGSLEITTIIENQLENLSFQGAGGWVQFNKYRSVSTPVEIYWVLQNRTEKLVGKYDPLNTTGFHVDIDASQIPSDLPRMEYFLIPLPVAVILYIVIAVLVVFITVQFILYIYYRNEKAIKATSPYLSLLMFAGCYFLCAAGTMKLTYGTFVLLPQTFVFMLSTNIVLVLNGFGLILITLFIKLLRVYRIFYSRLKMDLGRYWSNFPLFLTIIVLAVIPNIVVVTLIAVFPPEYNTTNIYRETYTEVHIELKSTNYFVIGGIIASYVTLFSFIILFLAIRTRKIKHKNFKDTKKLSFFIYCLLFSLAIKSPLYIIFLVKENEPAANIILVVGMMFVSFASQVILFLPKVLPTFLSNVYPSWESIYTTKLLLSISSK